MIPWFQFIPGTLLLIVAVIVAARKKTPPMSLANSVTALQAASAALATQVQATVASIEANGDAAASQAIDSVTAQLGTLTSTLATATPATIPAPPPAAE
jgi:hypothetical protein